MFPLIQVYDFFKHSYLCSFKSKSQKTHLHFVRINCLPSRLKAGSTLVTPYTSLFGLTPFIGSRRGWIVKIFSKFKSVVLKVYELTHITNFIFSLFLLPFRAHHFFAIDHNSGYECHQIITIYWSPRL